MQYRYLTVVVALVVGFVMGCGGDDDSGFDRADDSTPELQPSTPEATPAGPASSERDGNDPNNVAGASLEKFASIDGCITLSTKVTCTRADLRALDLSGSDLSFFDFISSDLSGVNLAGATLVGTVFNGSDLTGAILSGATLTAADLRGTDLSGATLTGADMTEAHLGGATYPWSDERESAFPDVTLCNTRLTSMEVSDRDC